MCHHGGCVCSTCYDAEVANERQRRWRHARNVRGSSHQVVLAFEFGQIPPFSGFHVSSARGEWAWVTGQLQFTSRWLWMIVNKVKLITRGCQLWSHFLPGADGSHFGSSLKLWHRRLPHMWISHRLARVIVITCRVGSFVSNVSINRQSPAVLLSLSEEIHIYEVWSVCVNICNWLCALFSLQTWSPDVRLYKQKVSHYPAPGVPVPWGIGCLFVLKH